MGALLLLPKTVETLLLSMLKYDILTNMNNFPCYKEQIMLYRAKDEVIPRDIAGIYFLVDITEKDYYSKKEIYSTNEIGYEQFKIMKMLSVFSVPDMLQEFIKLLNDYNDNMYDMILKDAERFVANLITAGYLEEYQG